MGRPQAEEAEGGVGQSASHTFALDLAVLFIHSDALSLARTVRRGHTESITLSAHPQ